MLSYGAVVPCLWCGGLIYRKQHEQLNILMESLPVEKAMFLTSSVSNNKLYFYLNKDC